MVAVFAVFASLSALDVKQMGVGFAVAVLLDATLIRGVLLPAAMKLVGDWNWYLPRWLRWLPRLNLEPEVAAGVQVPTPPSRWRTRPTALRPNESMSTCKRAR
jgi:RND superfamily putative drug exporter